MRSAAMSIVCVLLAAVLFADDQSLRGRTRFTYFACVDSKATRCYAFTEKQKKGCNCGQWEPRLFDRDLSADLDADDYLYKHGKARGSKVLADFETAVT